MAIRILCAVLVVTAAISAGDNARAADAKLDNYMAACTTDPDLVEEFQGDPKVTPQVFCECVSGKLKEANATQADIDMLTKMHKDDISDEDAENYPTLEDLMNANEGYEDSCKTSLGLPADVEDDFEEMPMEEDMVPQEEEAPAKDDGSPPE